MRRSAASSGVTFVRVSFIAMALSLIIVFVPSCKKEEATFSKEVPYPTVGSKAPLFTLRDVKGNVVSLTDLKGKIVVMDFWATWCSWCKKTTQDLEKIHKEYQDEDVVILGISMDSGGDAKQKVRDFALKYNLSYVMLVDDGKVSRSYEVNKIPTTFILDRDHVIRKIFPGYLPGLRERIVSEIEKSLSKS
ncbi:MAG: peroxiredoxin family protein [Acidobacteriota bacterium]